MTALVAWCWRVPLSSHGKEKINPLTEGREGEYTKGRGHGWEVRSVKAQSVLNT